MQQSPPPIKYWLAEVFKLSFSQKNGALRHIKFCRIIHHVTKNRSVASLCKLRYVIAALRYVSSSLSVITVELELSKVRLARESEGLIYR